MTQPHVFTQDQIDFAAQQESNAQLKEQVKYLSERVVLLRALVNHLQSSSKETENPTEEVTNNDGSNSEDLGSDGAGTDAGDGDGDASGDGA